MSDRVPVYVASPSYTRLQRFGAGMATAGPVVRRGRRAASRPSRGASTNPGSPARSSPCRRIRRRRGGRSWGEESPNPRPPRGPRRPCLAGENQPFRYRLELEVHRRPGDPTQPCSIQPHPQCDLVYDRLHVRALWMGHARFGVRLVPVPRAPPGHPGAGDGRTPRAHGQARRRARRLHGGPPRSQVGRPARDCGSRARRSLHPEAGGSPLPQTTPWRRTGPLRPRDDGARRPLHGIPPRRGLPVIGYVERRTTRRMLAREHWVRVPELTAAERSGLFAMRGRPLRLLPARGRPGALGGPLARHRPPGDAVQASAGPPRSRRAERAAGWLPGLRLDSAPGRAGPGELDADRGPRTASAPAAGGRTPRLARGARGGARTQPRRKDGIIADCPPPAHRGRQRCRISEPFAHDSRTATLAGGRPCGAAPGVRPRTRKVAA